MATKKRTDKTAFEDALEGAKSGKPGYQNFVGYCYDTGQGVSQDASLARHWWEKASRNGNADAMFNLAVTYDLGQDVSRSATRARRLYQQAAERGHLQAQTNLAAMLLDGDGGKADAAAGFQWMRRAARRGDSEAQYNMGRAYLEGLDGLRQSDRHAQTWLSKAAKGGHAEAKRLLKALR